MLKTLASAAIALALLSTTATAQTAIEGGTFGLELNTSENVGGSCRLTYVANNKTGEDLLKTAYEVAVFNTSGVVSDLLILEFGAIQNDVTRVVMFDINNQPCEDISRILVNNMVQCETANGASNACMTQLASGTRETSIAFTH